MLILICKLPLFLQTTMCNLFVAYQCSYLSKIMSGLHLNWDAKVYDLLWLLWMKLIKRGPKCKKFASYTCNVAVKNGQHQSHPIHVVFYMWFWYMVSTMHKYVKHLNKANMLRKYLHCSSIQAFFKKKTPIFEVNNIVQKKTNE